MRCSLVFETVSRGEYQHFERLRGKQGMARAKDAE
jgi:hypothetical protein